MLSDTLFWTAVDCSFFWRHRLARTADLGVSPLPARAACASPRPLWGGNMGSIAARSQSHIRSKMASSAFSNVDAWVRFKCSVPSVKERSAVVFFFSCAQRFFGVYSVGIFPLSPMFWRLLFANVYCFFLAFSMFITFNFYAHIYILLETEYF
jgi:hypothetical protein